MLPFDSWIVFQFQTTLLHMYYYLQIIKRITNLSFDFFSLCDGHVYRFSLRVIDLAFFAEELGSYLSAR